MAPTPVSAAVPQIEQHILGPDDDCTLKEDQLSTRLMNIMKKNAAEAPDLPAQIHADSGKALTFSQFLEQTIRTAQGLRALGLVPGDAITLMARNMNYTFTTCIAAYLDGILLHPMFAMLEPELVIEQIHSIKPRIIFTETFALDRIRPAIKGMSPKPRVVVLDRDDVEDGMMTMEALIRLGSNVDVEHFEEVYLECPEDDNALIIFTTGSTGPPKPVMHTAKSVQCLIEQATGIMNYASRVLIAPLVSWITGQCVMLGGLNGRNCLVYTPELTLDKHIPIFNEHQISTYVGSPFAALQLALRGSLPSSLRQLVLGGSPLSSSSEKIVFNAMGEKTLLCPVYGSTEVGVVVSSTHAKFRKGAVGRCRPGCELQVRDIRSGRPLPANERGRLFVRAPALMKGYMNLPHKTSEVVNEHRWIDMGDYGFYDEDGYIYIFDRLRDIVFYKDHVILPSVLTDVIRQHPDVVDSAICGVSHPKDNQHIVAFVSLKPGKTMTEDDLNAHVEKICGESHRLRGGVVFLERVPRTLSGKVASTTLLEKVQQKLEAEASA